MFLRSILKQLRPLFHPKKKVEAPRGAIYTAATGSSVTCLDFKMKVT